MKTPGIFHLSSLLDSAASVKTTLHNSKRWIPARPQTGIGFKARLKAAWLVFTGKADAVIWPGGQ